MIPNAIFLPSTDLLHDGHPLLSSFFLQPNKTLSKTNQSKSFAKINSFRPNLSQNITKSFLQPSQTGWPSTHCQILMGGFISYNMYRLNRMFINKPKCL